MTRKSIDELIEILCEAEINGERIVYDACRHNVTLEQAKEDYRQFNFEYIGSSNIAYYDGVRNEHANIIHFFKRPYKHTMALRTLDSEEITFLDKQMQELQLLHQQNKNGAAYSYDWQRLSTELQDIITAYKRIADTTKLYQYEQYLSNGGTMTMEEWEMDGRFDPSSVEH